MSDPSFNPRMFQQAIAITGTATPQETTPFLTHIYSVENSIVFWNRGTWPFCFRWLPYQTKVFGILPYRVAIDE